MAHRFRQFHGGYRFHRFAGSPAPVKEAFGAPETVRLSLVSGSGALVPAVVKPGQTVQVGQIVAQGGPSPSSPIVASINGTVRSLSKDGRILEIASDGSAGLPVLERRLSEWREATRERIEDALYLSGITGYPAGGIPTRRGSSAVGPDELREVIVEAAYADVWSPALDVLLQGGIERLVSGLGILAHLFPKAGFTVVVDKSEQGNAARIRAAAGGRIDVLGVPSRYPLAIEAVLLKAVLGRSLEPGLSAIRAGVLILDVETAMQVHDVVVEGIPPVERVIALAGPGFARPCHISARLGTPIEAIAARYLTTGEENRLLVGSPMAGEVADETRGVDPRCRMISAIPENRSGEVLSFARPGLEKDSYSRTFVAGFLPVPKRLDTNVHGEGRACISCGFCEDVCPAGILPQLLHRYVKRDIIDESILRYRIMDCIDCNLCSYVCPSKIPVAELMKKGKERLVQEGLYPPSKEGTPA